MYSVLFRRASFFYWVEDKSLGEVANHKFVRSESDIQYTSPFESPTRSYSSSLRMTSEV